MDFKESTLEHAIIYLAYVKAVSKKFSMHIGAFSEKGIFDEAEQALIESLQIGFMRLDGEFEQAIEHCLARTDKQEHILLAINATLKKQELI